MQTAPSAIPTSWTRQSTALKPMAEERKRNAT